LRKILGEKVKWKWWKVKNKQNLTFMKGISVECGSSESQNYGRSKSLSRNISNAFIIAKESLQRNVDRMEEKNLIINLTRFCCKCIRICTYSC